jgi:exopolysaccharide/PEP-CTERM locus tyrosine autokinase
MSKIQEALKRLQSTDRPRDRSESVARVTDRVVDNDDTASLSYERPGIVIEVDEEALREEGLIAPGTYEREIADQYRQIKRPLIASAFGKRATQVEDGKTVMVTSASSGEGKTFTSINLALSMAQERDHSILLVDADVAKPHISRIFGVGEELGLLDIVENAEIVPESLVIDTDIDGLSILPAGQPRENAAELLGSNRMEQVVRDLAARFPNRIVLFDTPPLLETSESKVLLELAGQVVVVVRAEHTTHGAVHEALHLIKEEKAINFVLNQTRGKSGQGSYYGYGYGAGANESRDQSRQDPPRQNPQGAKDSLWGDRNE